MLTHTKTSDRFTTDSEKKRFKEIAHTINGGKLEVYDAAFNLYKTLENKKRGFTCNELIEFAKKTKHPVMNGIEKKETFINKYFSQMERGRYFTFLGARECEIKGTSANSYALSFEKDQKPVELMGGKTAIQSIVGHYPLLLDLIQDAVEYMEEFKNKKDYPLTAKAIEYEIENLKNIKKTVTKEFNLARKTIKYHDRRKNMVNDA